MLERLSPSFPLLSFLRPPPLACTVGVEGKGEVDLSRSNLSEGEITIPN